MLNKGYIEGFYGRLMSLNDRTILLKKLSELSMDFYVYGPKEDPYHRSNWTSIYPKDKAVGLQNFKIEGDRLGIRTYMALSPLISTSDDLNKATKAVLKINEFTEKENGLIFCPTVYCNKFAKGKLSNSTYLKTLSKKVPESIPMLWTGKEVVSKTISDADILSLKEVLSNPIIIWDNYYANDYCPRKLFIGDYQGRDFSENSPMGIGINPTGLPITDSIILSQVEGSKSTEDILRKNNVPDCFKEVLPFFNGPFNEVPELEGLENIKSLLKLSTPLCIDWKSELQLEWAPYLWNFFIDLNFLMKLYKSEDQKGLEEWASQRYSNPLNEIIFRRNTNN